MAGTALRAEVPVCLGGLRWEPPGNRVRKGVSWFGVVSGFRWVKRERGGFSFWCLDSHFSPSDPLKLESYTLIPQDVLMWQGVHVSPSFSSWKANEKGHANKVVCWALFGGFLKGSVLMVKEEFFQQLRHRPHIFPKFIGEWLLYTMLSSADEATPRFFCSRHPTQHRQKSGKFTTTACAINNHLGILGSYFINMMIQ